MTATDLEQWAATYQARAALPDLVKSLIRATAEGIASFRFPSGESIGLPGYDGVLQVSKSTSQYIPKDWSCWEMSVDSSPLPKATRDFKKRTAAPGLITPKQATYVCVTPFRLGAKKDAWLKSRRALKKWADVRLIDAVDLEAWLDLAPAVAVEFARSLRLVPPDAGAVRSSEDYWDDYSKRTKYPLNEALLLADRSSQQAALLAAIARSGSSVAIRAESIDEGMAFLLATIRTAEPENRKFLESRTVVASRGEIAQQLRPPLIICIRVGGPDVVGQLTSRGHTVIVLQGNDELGGPSAILLQRPTGSAFVSALQDMGVARDDAERYARESGRSVTVLQRRMPHTVLKPPEWAIKKATDPFVSIALVGGWDESSKRDCELVAAAANLPYSEVESRARELSLIQDPPVEHVGTVWRLVAPVDAFEVLARVVTPSHLDRLRTAMQKVFGERDPALDLPPEERPYAALHGKVLEHSQWLRHGLAQTLLLVAVSGEQAGLSYPGGCGEFVDSIIRSLPDIDRDYRVIASIQDQLPLLAEAAPDPFLGALERMLGGGSRELAKLFSEGGLLGTSSPHTGLLLALEGLAWHLAYLHRVTMVLAGLHALDPGGKLSNRPLRTLREIFLPWQPSTSVSLEGRAAVLDSLSQRAPDVAWSLLVELLPDSNGISFPTYRPRLRDPGVASDSVRSHEEVRDAFSQVMDRVVAQVGRDPRRWVQVISRIDRFAPSHRLSLFERLADLASTLGNSIERNDVQKELRKQAARHKRFSHTSWALPEVDTSRLSALCESFAPLDSNDQDVWLFDEYWPSVFADGDERPDRALMAARLKAVRGLYETQGVEGLLRLASTAKLPSLVGAAAADVVNDFEALDALTRGVRGSAFASAFISALSGDATRRHQAAWTSHLKERSASEQWPVDLAVDFLLNGPDEPAYWKTVAEFGPEVEAAYWQRKPAFILKVSVDDLAFAIAKYVAAGRAADALDASHGSLTDLPPGVSCLLLDRAFDELNESKVRDPQHLSWLVSETLEELADRDDVDRLEVARREYSWLPAIRWKEEKLVIHDVLATSADFFVQVVCDVFRASTGDAGDVSEADALRARVSYQLLESWTTVPGTSEDGSVDTRKLTDWVTKARDLAAERDRAAVADLQIGAVLAHAPIDPEDGGWPTRSVRTLIESVASDEIESGLATEQFNKRGAYSKAMYEGGAQERKLADQARAWSTLATAWPRTSALLERIAKRWEAEAKRADEHAELEKRRFS